MLISSVKEPLYAWIATIAETTRNFVTIERVAEGSGTIMRPHYELSYVNQPLSCVFFFLKNLYTWLSRV